MDTEIKSSAGKGLTAPYAPYSSLETAALHLKKNGAMPQKLDRQVLHTMSGGLVGQLLPALKFLGLTDSDSRPNDRFAALVQAAGTEAWSGVLGTTLKDAYQPLFSLDLETASPSMFNERFKSAYQGTDEVQRKSVAFFLNAARAANIKISPYIIRNKKPRVASGKKRLKKNGTAAVAEPESKTHTNQQSPPPPPNPAAPRTSYEVLMNDIYDPTAMKPNSEEEKAVFTLARFLKSKGTNAP